MSLTILLFILMGLWLTVVIPVLVIVYAFGEQQASQRPDPPERQV